MAQQLTLDLPLRPAMGRDDFYVSNANAAAVAQIDDWEDWPSAKLVLCGPSGSGKTHLAHVWAAATGAQIVAALDITAQLETLSEAPALVVEDADKICEDRSPQRGDREEGLFHLHNALAHRGAPLLITAKAPPSRWGIGLPDLASRMAQAGLAKLDAPDDALLMAVMMKRAVDRKLPLKPKMLTYAAPRLERSFQAADAFIARVDALALSEKRKPTLAHVKAALAQQSYDPSS
ncbi:P-loop NTPase family protein [Gymnodinialimonas sp.]